MGFSLKKFVSFFLEPFSLAFIIIILAFIFLILNSYKKAKKLLFLAIFVLFIFSNSYISDKLLLPLETKYEKLDVNSVKDVKYALLLGGNFEARAYEIVRLYQGIDALKVITSGYKGSSTISQAMEARNRLVELGINIDDIIVHEEPKDTIEEAIAVKELLSENEEFILVTSASHMPRAMEIFKSFELNPIPAPTAFEVKEKKNESFIDIGALEKSHMALHEYIGLLWLRVKNLI